MGLKGYMQWGVYFDEQIDNYVQALKFNDEGTYIIGALVSNSATETYIVYIDTVTQALTHSYRTSEND